MKEIALNRRQVELSRTEEVNLTDDMNHMNDDDECEPISQTTTTVLEIDAHPFKGLKISENWEKLESLKERTACKICKKSRKYFCYSCYVPTPETEEIVPKLQLPVKIDIIKHAREIDGKSTAVHAAVLAPDDVRIFTYPCIPDYEPTENVVLIFPNKDAVSVEEMYMKFSRDLNEPDFKRRCVEGGGGHNRPSIHRAVFIDSTWNQSRGIFKDTRIKSLPSVVLKSRLSQFWRHQADSPRWYLATVEAIHQFLVELDTAQGRVNHRTNSSSSDRCKVNVDSEKTCSGSDQHQNTKNSSNSEYDKKVLRDSDKLQTVEKGDVSREEYCYGGQYDNLLFFFRFMYSKIHTLYDHEQLRSYKRRLE